MVEAPGAVISLDFKIPAILAIYSANEKLVVAEFFAP
jgi:hypothetical protein